MAEQSSWALILLAAGASTRMGRPKQLLPVGGRPLLRHVVEAVLAAPVSPVVVVLGANATEIAPCLEGLSVRVVVNPGWAEGMGSSMRAGMDSLISCAPAAAGVIVALADQPDLASGHLARLIEAQHVTGRPIVASECGGVRGPPVLFAASFFPALRTLQGDAGARPLLQAHAHEVVTVPLATAHDLDTPADYVGYLSRPPPDGNQAQANAEV
jgi:molybdenum cofactor cytidylyltransferase